MFCSAVRIYAKVIAEDLIFLQMSFWSLYSGDVKIEITLKIILTTLL